MAKITYTDKVDLNTTAVNAVNKVSAADINEIKDSINALYNIPGWANYADTGGDLVVSTSDTLLTIDKNTSIETYLPLSIRGSGTLWASNAITPESTGDAYDVRLSFTVGSKAGNPTRINIQLDIGGGATPSNVISERVVTAEKTPPYSTSIAFPIFCLATFVANGGQFFLTTDTGTVTLGARSIFIKRDFSEV